MFRVPRLNVVESDEGFSVEVLGRTGLRYCEGERCAFVDSEVLLGPSGMLVSRRALAKWEDGIPFDGVTRDRVIENIRRAFKYEGFDIEICD